jgi:hypothetical protein
MVASFEKRVASAILHAVLQAELHANLPQQEKNVLPSWTSWTS